MVKQWGNITMCELITSMKIELLDTYFAKRYVSLAASIVNSVGNWISAFACLLELCTTCWSYVMLNVKGGETIVIFCNQYPISYHLIDKKDGRCNARHPWSSLHVTTTSSNGCILTRFSLYLQAIDAMPMHYWRQLCPDTKFWYPCCHISFHISSV